MEDMSSARIRTDLRRFVGKPIGGGALAGDIL